MSENDPAIISRTVYFLSFTTIISSMIISISILSITVLLCDRKKKKSQQQTPGTATPKSLMKPAKSQVVSAMKKPESPKPGAGGGAKNDQQQQQPSQPPKSTPQTPVNKSKGDRKSRHGASEKLFATPLDKTQEESNKPASAKSASKESGENKKEEGTTNAAKDTKETDKKEEEEKKSEPPPIVPEDKVQVLGNLDDVIKEKKTQLQKEIEDMGSLHEHDKVKEEPLDPEKHVVINEKKCKLYTTNNEETKEDDNIADDLI